MNLPSIPYEDWKETKTTLHLFAQIIGKLKLSLSPEQKHWWHIPLYVSPLGLTTGPVFRDDRSLEFLFNFHTHQLEIRDSAGEARAIDLTNASVSEFYQRLMKTLEDLRCPTKILAKPFDPEKVGSDIPFAEDTTHSSYDSDAVRRFWLALVQIDKVFREFKGQFVGKSSPSHFFWHSFDLAVTRFSGKALDLPVEADPVTRGAYSHEVISAGFWPGDENVPMPAFYAYAHPEPEGLGKAAIKPEKAFWQPVNGTHMGILSYDALRESADPRAALMSFLSSTYNAAAELANWPDELKAES